VRNGLSLVTSGLVAIHDGARPLITHDIIRHSFAEAAEKGNAVTAVKLKDSIREALVTGGTRSANRSNYYLVQTPQTFQTKLIRNAYDRATHYNFTDDAGVLEESGGKINLVEGSYSNIKITTPEDLVVAGALLGLKG
jgi:2-C-methyl-D-erythritol 4-phosphate cytidylyltransferase